MPCDYARYPSTWQEMRAAVLARAGNRCEGSPAYPNCRAENHTPHPVTGSRVVLTIAHKPGTSKMTEDLEDLLSLCQRCHLEMDRKHHLREAALTRERKKYSSGQMPLPGLGFRDASAIPPSYDRIGTSIASYPTDLLLYDAQSRNA